MAYNRIGLDKTNIFEYIRIANRTSLSWADRPAVISGEMVSCRGEVNSWNVRTMRWNVRSSVMRNFSDQGQFCFMGGLLWPALFIYTYYWWSNGQNADLCARYRESRSPLAKEKADVAPENFYLRIYHHHHHHLYWFIVTHADYVGRRG